jgi:hypothetical protein
MRRILGFLLREWFTRISLPAENQRTMNDLPDNIKDGWVFTEVGILKPTLTRGSRGEKIEAP